MAWLGIIFLIFIYLDAQEARNLSWLDPFIPTSYARGEKNPFEPRSSCFNYPQATALTPRPCLLGRQCLSLLLQLESNVSTLKVLMYTSNWRLYSEIFLIRSEHCLQGLDKFFTNLSKWENLECWVMNTRRWWWGKTNQRDDKENL